jgi:hypothetical protein
MHMKCFECIANYASADPTLQKLPGVLHEEYNKPIEVLDLIGRCYAVNHTCGGEVGGVNTKGG